jgi:hypothetical protein
LTRHPRASRSDAQLAARELLRIGILSTRWLLGDSPAGQKATADPIMTTLPRPTALYGRGFSFGATVLSITTLAAATPWPPITLGQPLAASQTWVQTWVGIFYSYLSSMISKLKDLDMADLGSGTPAPALDSTPLTLGKSSLPDLPADGGRPFRGPRRPMPAVAAPARRAPGCGGMRPWPYAPG